MFIKKRLHIHMCIVQKKDLKEIPQRVNDEFSLGPRQITGETRGGAEVLLVG